MLINLCETLKCNLDTEISYRYDRFSFVVVFFKKSKMFKFPKEILGKEELWFVLSVPPFQRCGSRRKLVLFSRYNWESTPELNYFFVLLARDVSTLICVVLSHRIFEMELNRMEYDQIYIRILLFKKLTKNHKFFKEKLKFIYGDLLVICAQINDINLKFFLW